MLELHWSVAPLSIKLFWLYMAFLLGLTIIRALRLTSRFFRVRKTLTSIEHLHNHSVTPQVFADSALGNRVDYHSSTPVNRTNDDAEGDMEALQTANSRFRLAARASQIQIASTRRLLRLGMLLLPFVISRNLFTLWHYFYDEAKITGLEAMMQAVQIVFDWVSLAVAGYIFVFAVLAFLSGVLEQREISWQRFCSSNNVI